jgi:hypothetical protein
VRAREVVGLLPATLGRAGRDRDHVENLASSLSHMPAIAGNASAVIEIVITAKLFAAHCAAALTL